MVRVRVRVRVRVFSSLILLSSQSLFFCAFPSSLKVFSLLCGYKLGTLFCCTADSLIFTKPPLFLRLPSSFLPFPSSFKVFYLMHNAIRFTTLRLQLEHSLLLHSQLSYLHKAFSFAHFPPILKSLSLYKFSILCTTLLDSLLCGYNWEEEKRHHMHKNRNRLYLSPEKTRSSSNTRYSGLPLCAVKTSFLELFIDIT